MGLLEAIWLKPVRREVLEPVETAKLRAGQGMVGNRHQGGRRQVTILEREAWEAVAREVNTAVAAEVRRANLLVSGVSLRETTGRVLEVGGCRLRIGGETRPCDLMDAAIPGLKAAIGKDWRGGVFAEVLDDGTITIGDDVRLTEE
jgi:MOSC domain-containing protein YiiM